MFCAETDTSFHSPVVSMPESMRLAWKQIGTDNTADGAVRSCTPRLLAEQM